MIPDMDKREAIAKIICKMVCNSIPCYEEATGEFKPCQKLRGVLDQILALFEPEKPEQMWQCPKWQKCNMSWCNSMKEHQKNWACEVTSSACPACQPVEPAKHTHYQTDDEKEIEEIQEKAWQEGYEAGRQSYSKGHGWHPESFKAGVGIGEHSAESYDRAFADGKEVTAKEIKEKLVQYTPAGASVNVSRAYFEAIFAEYIKPEEAD